MMKVLLLTLTASLMTVQGMAVQGEGQITSAEAAVRSSVESTVERAAENNVPENQAGSSEKASFVCPNPDCDGGSACSYPDCPNGAYTAPADSSYRGYHHAEPAAGASRGNRHHNNGGHGCRNW